MPIDLIEKRSAAASAGASLTTTAQRIVFPIGTQKVKLMPHTFSTAVVARFALNPYLIIIKTTDALVATANATNYSVNAQDGSTGTKVTLDSLDTLANGDIIYIGSHTPFAGVDIDINNANSIASVLTVKYWNGTAWVTISASDGTVSTGKTMAVDGIVSWTVPTAWAKTSLKAAGDTVLTDEIYQRSLYWTRWEVSAALDSTTDANSFIAVPQTTAYAEIPSGHFEEFDIIQGQNGYSGISALTDAGTAKLVVNVTSNRFS